MCRYIPVWAHCPLPTQSIKAWNRAQGALGPAEPPRADHVSAEVRARGRPPTPWALSAGSLREPPRRISRAAPAPSIAAGRKLLFAGRRGNGAGDAPWSGAQSARALSAPPPPAPAARGFLDALAVITLGRRRAVGSRGERLRAPLRPKTYAHPVADGRTGAHRRARMRNRRAQPIEVHGQEG
jgi:hypothetical protein